MVPAAEHEVIAAIAVEVGHGDDPVVAPEALRLQVRERLSVSGSRRQNSRQEENASHEGSSCP